MWTLHRIANAVLYPWFGVMLLYRIDPNHRIIGVRFKRLK